MKNLIISGLIIFILLAIFPQYISAQVDPNLRNRLQQNGSIIIDHRSISLFDQIPDIYIQRAKNISLMLRHASIGENIKGGLTCVNRGSTRDVCLTFPSGSHPIDFNVWNFQNRGNPGWQDKIEDFSVQVEAQISQRDVFMYKFCFLSYNQNEWDKILNGGNYGGPYNGMAWVQNYLTEYNSTHGTNKWAVWWTGPITRTNGYAAGQNANDQTRQYVRLNKQILFDIADIESYDNNGQPVRVDGMEVAWQPWCLEQLAGGAACHLSYPDRPGCTFSENGCEGSAVRVAKAFWVLMAQMAGWSPGGNIPTPTRTPTPTRNPTSSPTNTPTISPTPVAVSGNLNSDRIINIQDLLLFKNFFQSRNLLADFNNNRIIDIFDLSIQIKNYGRSW